MTDDQLAGKVLGLARYDAMVLAIAACHRVDEVKEIRDKARALEVYAGQALNRQAERRAIQIRIRAERRAGELLIETARNGQRDKGRGGNRKSRSPRPTVKLGDYGISKDQSSQWQKLAKIPEAQFEELVKDQEAYTSTEEIIRRAGPKPAQEIVEFDGRIISLWIGLEEFEHKQFDQKTKSILDYEPAFVVGKMDAMDRQKATRLAPRVIAWLNKLVEEVKNADGK